MSGLRRSGHFSRIWPIGWPVSSVTFPEAVALAEILADPHWRQHVATVPVRQAGQFYRRVSARLGEGTYQAPAFDDPIIAWAQHHRSGFADRETPLRG